jgi:hypothetical protein
MLLMAGRLITSLLGTRVSRVPQVQLEMLCLGPNCRATNFLSCSATKGINIMRRVLLYINISLFNIDVCVFYIDVILRQASTSCAYSAMTSTLQECSSMPAFSTQLLL